METKQDEQVPPAPPNAQAAQGAPGGGGARWHASMSGQENGPVAAAVSTELQNSGCQFTFTHFQNEGWFEDWGRKLHRAVGVIVIFSESIK